MRRTTRRVIFYLLVLAFTFVGPLAVAYSLGYNFNFYDGSFETTGGIFIKSRTPRLLVFLDGALARETGIFSSSTLLTDLKPRAHLVRLEKEGFRPWSKLVMVEPTAVTEIRDIMLVPYLPAIATSTPQEFWQARAISTAPRIFSVNSKGALVAQSDAGARVVAENIHSFAAVGNAAFFVNHNGFLARSDERGEITTLGRPGFYLNKEPLRFVVGKGTLAIIDSGGGLFVYDEAAGAAAPAASDVKEAIPHPAGDKLLIRKENRIEILWLKNNPRQPFQNKGTPETIIVSSNPIRDADWFYATDQHIVYRTGDGVFFTEIDGRGGRYTIQLVSGPTEELFTSPSFPGAIFYKKEGAAYKIEL